MQGLARLRSRALLGLGGFRAPREPLWTAAAALARVDGIAAA